MQLGRKKNWLDFEVKSLRSQQDQISSNKHFWIHFLTYRRSAWMYFNKTYLNYSLPSIHYIYDILRSWAQRSRSQTAFSNNAHFWWRSLLILNCSENMTHAHTHLTDTRISIKCATPVSLLFNVFLQLLSFVCRQRTEREKLLAVDLIQTTSLLSRLLTQHTM